MIIQLTEFFPWGLIMNLLRGAICFNITHAILKDKYNAFVSCGSILAFSLLYSFLTYTFLDYRTEMLQMAGYYIFLTVILIFTSEGGFFAKAFSSVSALLSWTGAALLFSAATQSTGKDTVQSGISYNIPLVDFMMYIVFMFAFSFIVAFLFKIIKAKISKKMKYEKKYVIYFIFPVTHMMYTMLIVVILRAFDDNTYHHFISEYPAFETVFSLCAAICVLADFLIIFMVDRQSKTENENSRYERQLLKNQMDYQQTKMLADEKNEFRKLKHDLANLLTTAQGFIEIGKPEKALEILKSTEKDINELAGIPICANETVNTVFYIKQQLAHELGVDMNIEVEQTSALLVDDYSVCRIMHNILDNALYAAAETDAKQVHLTVKIDEDAFALECKNSCAQSSKKRKRKGDHGHGISIIKDIAGKYGGIYTDQKENGLFCSTTELKNLKLSDSTPPPPEIWLNHAVL